MCFIGTISKYVAGILNSVKEINSMLFVIKEDSHVLATLKIYC